MKFAKNFTPQNKGVTKYQIYLDNGSIWYNDKTSMWGRRCPRCQKELYYKEFRHCSAIHKKNTSCKSCSRKGQVISVSQRKFLSEINRGKKHSEATKTKMSLSLKGHFSACKGRPITKKHFEAIENNCFKRKPYSFPNGKIVKIQGYENFTLDFLLLSFSLDDIKTEISEKPVIPYEFFGNKNYYPDCFLPLVKTIVETKSLYTWNMSLLQNKAKILSTVRHGYDFRLLIWNKKGDLLLDFTFPRLTEIVSWPLV